MKKYEVIEVFYQPEINKCAMLDLETMTETVKRENSRMVVSDYIMTGYYVSSFFEYPDGCERWHLTREKEECRYEKSSRS